MNSEAKMFWFGLFLGIGFFGLGGIILTAEYSVSAKLIKLQIAPCIDQGYTETHCLKELKHNIGTTK